MVTKNRKLITLNKVKKTSLYYSLLYYYLGSGVQTTETLCGSPYTIQCFTFTA